MESIYRFPDRHCIRAVCDVVRFETCNEVSWRVFPCQTLFAARKYVHHAAYEHGLTFGTIASVFGLNAGYIDQTEYSVLVGVVVASAVIPTFIAQKWFTPVHSEDIVDINNNR